MENSVCLDLRDVTKNFGGLRATDNVSFQVQVGERRAIIGPNGAGKTTLLSTIAGLLPAVSGEVKVASEPMRSGSARTTSRAGVTLVVRRPVHPATLRSVLRHALYRGPERRREARVGIGLPVRYRLGWWPRRGLLQELSPRGAGLLLPRALQPVERQVCGTYDPFG